MNSIEETEERANSCWKVALLWAVVALVLRLGVLLSFREEHLFSLPLVDGRFYLEWSRQMAVDGPFAKSPFTMSPLYAWVLWLAGPDFLRYFLPALGAGTVFFCSLIAGVLGKEKAAHAAGFLSAFALPLAMADLNLMKTGLGVFLLSAALYGVVAGVVGGKKEGAGKVVFLVAGILMGLAALVREPLLAAGLALAVGLLFLLKVNQKWVAIILFCVGLFLIPALSAIGQKNVSGQGSLLTAAGGEALWIGLGPGADGTFQVPPFARPDPAFQHQDFHQQARQMTGKNLSPKEADRWWAQEAIRHALANPGQTAKLILIKIRLLLNANEVPSDLSEVAWKSKVPWLQIFGVGWIFLIPLGIAGCFSKSERQGAKSVLVLFLAAGVFLLLPFFIYDRFRLFALFPLIPLAGLGLASLMDKKLHLPTLLSFGVVFLVVLVDRSWVKAEPRRGYDQRLLGDLAFVAKDHAEAKFHYKKALKDPVFGVEAGLNLGVMAMEKGNLNEARDAFMAVLKKQENHPEALGNLAMVLTQAGRDKEALELFQKALVNDPENPNLWANFGAFFWKLKKFEAARAGFEKAMDLQKPFVSPDLLLKLVFVCIKSGEEEKARTYAAQLEKTSPMEARGVLKEIDRHFKK